jgi:endonuclease YncB( thermonuclease family)
MVQILEKSGVQSHEDVVRTHNDEAVKLIQTQTKTSSVIENKSIKLFVLLTLGIAALFSGSALAETLHGRVVGVSDGDTITVLDASNQQHKIRLSGIDAPEKAQPFGQRSKENLSRHVFGREVSVEWHKLDRYKRIVGKVLVAETSCREAACPKTFDVGHAQITVGLAWWYSKYAKDQSREDAHRYGSGNAPAQPRC